MQHVIFAAIALFIAFALYCCFEVSGRYSDREEEEDRK